MHLAAETHVDRSIDGPGEFVETNVVGTFRLLNAALDYWRGLEGERRDAFRFHHISTDEVFGALQLDRGIFTEETPYDPSSPYSASKAAADHFVRAWHVTYGLPVVLTNCSNNYGPYHFPEKLIPLVILNALDEKPLPVYGKGENVRDWLYVEDHARALELVLTRGRGRRKLQCRRPVGAQQPHGGRDDLRHPRPASGRAPAAAAIAISLPSSPTARATTFAMPSTRPSSSASLAGAPRKLSKSGMEKTVAWYLDNEWWWRPIRDGNYAGERLGGA